MYKDIPIYPLYTKTGTRKIYSGQKPPAQSAANSILSGSGLVADFRCINRISLICDMRGLLLLSLLLLIALEFFLVYFIMPLPGSQRMNSLPLAYFLWQWRWVLRSSFALLAILIAWRHPPARHWSALLFLALFAAVAYAFNGPMSAAAMFSPMTAKKMAVKNDNKADSNLLVIGVQIGTEAAAYPIQYIAYHHRVQDTVGGKTIFVTYCSVCRTGRVYEPVVQGKPAEFRLVGMDHFNAMFEDRATGSWWRQANGEAVTGPLKGQKLPEVFCSQMRLGTWLRLHPQSRILQPDTCFNKEYAQLEPYDEGKMKGKLTRSDTASWKDKSWVAGLVWKGQARAYDWNHLKRTGCINDTLQGDRIAVVLGNDRKSFSAWVVPGLAAVLNDSLRIGTGSYDLAGRSADGTTSLPAIPVYQEFWHSWKTFQPATQRRP